MCWTDKKHPVEYTAEKDIPVFKIGRVDKLTEEAIPYFYCGKGKTYIEGKEYNEPKDVCTQKVNTNIPGMPEEYCYVINKALHSYSVENIRLKTDYFIDSASAPKRKILNPYVAIITYKTTPLSQDTVRRGQTYMVVDNIAIILCTIPKGTKYYVNSVGEIASNSLHVHKVIKKPFTFNVDGKINKNSVNKVNALLNKWETLVMLNNKLCKK